MEHNQKNLVKSSKNLTIGTTLTDQRLVELAAQGKTAEEMSQITGLDAAECLVRVRNSLSAIDQWTPTEMSKLILLQMQEMLAQFKSAFEKKPTAQMADSVAKSLKNISDHYLKMRDLTIREEGIIGEQQKQILKLLLELAYNPVRDWVAREFGATPAQLDDMDAIFVQALREADNGSR